MKLACKIRIRFAWWLTWLYLPGVSFFSNMGMEPDMDKVQAAIEKAASVKVIPVQPNKS